VGRFLPYLSFGGEGGEWGKGRAGVKKEGGGVSGRGGGGGEGGGGKGGREF